MLNKIKDIVHSFRVSLLQRAMRGAGEIDLRGKRVLIVAPHPDDEVLGCGGLIARLCAQGNPPHIAILTGGEGSHRGCCDLSAQRLIDARRELTHTALPMLGFPLQNLHLLSYRDGSIPATESGMPRALASLIAQLTPDVVLVPHRGEGWPDHLNAAALARRALASTKAVVVEYCVWMWYYNVWSLDRKNASVLRMTDAEYQAKLAAADAYIKPQAPCGNPWSGVLPPAFVKATTARSELYFLESIQ